MNDTETEFQKRTREAREKLAALQAPWAPCGERIVAMELPRETETRGAIVLTDKGRDAEMKTRICEVLAVGPLQLEFAKGDRVMVGMYAGKIATFTSLDAVLILNTDEILQVIATPRAVRVAEPTDYKCPNCFSVERHDARHMRDIGAVPSCMACNAAMQPCAEPLTSSAQGDGAGL